MDHTTEPHTSKQRVSLENAQNAQERKLPSALRFGREQSQPGGLAETAGRLDLRTIWAFLCSLRLFAARISAFLSLLTLTTAVMGAEYLTPNDVVLPSETASAETVMQSAG